MQNVMWASEIWAIEPLRLNSCVKNTSRLMPITTSGVIIGSRSNVWTAPEPRKRSRASPSPSSEPRIVDPITATTATCIVTHSASRICWLPASLPYQSVVKPSHTKLRRDALKLNTISTTIGANSSA